LCQTLIEGRKATTSEQQVAFEDAFASYQGQEKRRDDVTLLALDLIPSSQ
jgi:hypothetical protein